MNSDKKKRLIIPVATLMVAIVMMAGVGYAATNISSTFTVNDNTTVGGEFKVTIDDYTSGKLFTSAKIPYGVNTTNGTTATVTNTVYEGDYVLVEGKTVKVTDNTGLNKAYTVTAKATSVALKGVLGDGKYELVATLEPAPGETGTYTGGKTFTLKVVLNVKSDVSISNPDNLNVRDITVTITATHTTS